MNTQQATHTPERYRVIAKGMHVGTVRFSQVQNGWQFIPLFQANPSRKFWPTADAAVAPRIGQDYALEIAP